MLRIRYHPLTTKGGNLTRAALFASLSAAAGTCMTGMCTHMRAGGIGTFQFIYFFSSFWGQFGPNCTTFLLAGDCPPVAAACMPCHACGHITGVPCSWQVSQTVHQCGLACIWHRQNFTLQCTVVSASLCCSMLSASALTTPCCRRAVPDERAHHRARHERGHSQVRRLAGLRAVQLHQQQVCVALALLPLCYSASWPSHGTLCQAREAPPMQHAAHAT